MSQVKTQAEVYGEVLMDIGAVTGGVIVGFLASYQIKKMAAKATAKDAAVPEQSIIVKLAPTLVGAVATYGAVATEDKRMRMFCIGAASAASAASLWSLAGSEATAKYVGVSLGVLPATDEVTPEDADDYLNGTDNDDIEDVEYEVNLPEEFSKVEYPQNMTTQGLAVLPANNVEETAAFYPIV